MRNLEIKCRADDLISVRRRALSAGGRSVDVLRQTDTYFRVSHGMLKLREIEGHPSELIAYSRPERSGSRVSDYRVYTTSDVESLRDVLQRTHDVLGVVRKSRELILMERTRVHLDTVEGLGTFVELETAGTDRPESEVAAEHTRVMAALSLDQDAGITTGYAALLGIIGAD